MIMKRSCIFYVMLMSCLTLSLKAQSDIAVGQWKTYFSYAESIDLLQADGEIVVATPNTLYVLALSDGLCRRVGVTEGLSDVGVSHIHWNEKTRSVLVCYTNSNIDIYDGSGVFNIRDLYEKQISGDKTIYQACVSGNVAYLACGFGVMVLDMAKRYVQETWFFQYNGRTLAVKDVAVKGDTVWAATADGIYYNTLGNRRIAQFSTWLKMEGHGLPDSMDVNRLVVYDDALYALRGASVWHDTVWESDSTFHEDVVPRQNSIYVYRNGRWCLDSIFGYEEVRNIAVSNGCLMVTYWNKAVAYRMSADGRMVAVGAFGSPQPRNSLYGDDGYLWIADKEKGLVRQLWTDEPAYYTPEGPITDGVWAMDANCCALAVVHGSPHDGWTPNWSHIQLSVYNGQRWSNSYVDVSYRDAMDVLFPSADPSECYITSYLHGLLCLKDGVVRQVYDSTNSTLEPYYGHVRCGKMAMDSNGNLWVLNPLAVHPLSVRTPKGEWAALNTGAISGTIVGDLMVDRRGWIWISGNREKTLMILNPNGTPTVTSDDQLVQLNTSLTEETGAFTYIYSIVEDKNGQVWLGTDRGIKIYYSPSRLFAYPSTLPYAPRVMMDSLVELLLYHEAVTCICVDQGNRKWVGTDNAGLFLLSEDGEQELLHFTSENSPLISNNIRSIAVLGSTGEVFVGTDCGLESFRYTATDPADDYAQLKVFPNPVREDFDGYISICGLVDDSEVKITDTKGGLVYRTRSNGGTAVWDGRRFDGTRAATGVYFVHATDQFGQVKGKGKILFIK